MRTIGVIATEHVAAALVANNQVEGACRRYPPADGAGESLHEMPAAALFERIREQVKLAAAEGSIDALGVGMPGIVRDGIVEESPNLPQIKGLHLKVLLAVAFPAARVLALNDADSVAAGIAATQGQLDKLVRVWTLGTGIGYGRYPLREGIGEGGHTVVSLEPKERYCGCGGEGHLEGIMGHRAMRLRFLDMEPEEIFANALEGDARCRAFVKMWHRALAAATASSIHLEGPGRFYVTGANSRFIDGDLLSLYLHEMVKMSTLQGSVFEVIPTNDQIAIIGAAVSAAQS